MLAMDNEINRLLELFDEVEVLQKDLEMRGASGLDAPALNETRNATWHLLRALRSLEDDFKRSEINKAIRHAQRAIYDCKEAMLLLELDVFKVFKDDYRNVSLLKFIPEWSDYRSRVSKAMDTISKARANIKDRDAFYKELGHHVSEIKEINHKCESIRPDLNKAIEDENDTKKKVTIGLVFTGLGLLVSILAFVFAK